MDKPKLAILFWFYKEVDICVNRLELILKHNPGVEIHGLYGGDKESEQFFKDKLSKYLTSFYMSPTTDANWKWIHGDLMILDWYDKFGRNFDFDSIVIVQWDMLIFDSINHQFDSLKKDEMYLSGLRDLDPYTEEHWEWTSPKDKYRSDYLNFLEYVKKTYSYITRPVPCCLFVLEVIPKIFFEKYLTVVDKEIGMLEYKIPVYAEIFNIKLISRENEAHWWGNVNKYPLNAEPVELKSEYIERELKKSEGWRIFHPFFKIWPL